MVLSIKPTDSRSVLISLSVDFLLHKSKAKLRFSFNEKEEIILKSWKTKPIYEFL